MANSSAYNRAYYESHRDETRTRTAAYQRQNRERINVKRQKKIAEMTPDELAAYRARKKDERDRVRLDVVVGYGGKCCCCGNDYLPHLTLDHVDGGGAEYRRTNTQVALYRKLRREGFPEGYQILCFNCNSAKYVLGRCECQDES